MKRLLVSGGLSVMVACSAAASIAPKPGTGDPRIQTVQYDAQQVVTLKVAAGFVLTLEFSPDEHIDNVALGNSSTWQVMPNKAADHLFIKPSQGAVDTNMTVITDSRVYNFELKLLPAPDPMMAFTLRFIYQPVTALLEDVAAPESATYRFRGDIGLRPSQMSDDGRFTSIYWGPKAPIPAVFIINAQGREALVNGAVRDGRFVIDQVANEFIFRLADREARASRHGVKVKR